ncbi:hypothetical protein A2331_01865 [Candidatus Falkowbacteria bacterium RIFOXYB2_FULL_34_18]|uniref:Uncharacterized protein n=1 Tax=Candidatus Falkowbacteria bacterium RIFOXYD2_FULL_34_120 TaxID=1798007 RepID=A0A1F5TQE2_9BACT|nr:MAG: hypothetical protein A2331_01865 [Candidatus Falkowbacteria bacterium RIFOXYB2_FULL_34_18]OGF29432.1 MAG: hypothetical protein A2500_00930 [Candidatus Falkowbacteria bacterium RIFOXYC12_FULL_34_55]OGF36745.1 MAG: hypothetical protein A2466_03240 [Candidatus Falkowbacteria bacterium RIFOXYC2_FULL_34_220]OGF38958.1 MAG: hypothetical protein A2515_05355 [Candidatus Falkowbacteria bacterium RIFOXYD12_FULL_34_57]OGF41150.1 MAG: hypothetical protein A2531_01355 [Candidatus Falkowbacteria bact
MGTLSEDLKKARELGQNIFVSEDGYDLCVCCKKKTQYKTKTDIDLRTWYVEGCGQLCEDCYNKIYR